MDSKKNKTDENGKVIIDDMRTTGISPTAVRLSEEEQDKLEEESLSKTKEYVTTNYEVAEHEEKTNFTPEELRTRNKIFKALQKTSQALAVETDIKTILEKIAETVSVALGAKQTNFWDFAPDEKGVYITAAYGMQQQYIDHSKKDPLPLGSAWVGRAMKTGQAWATSDVQKDPLLPKSWLPAVIEQNYHGLLCAPLKSKEGIIGGMCIYYEDIHVFDYFEINILSIVANQAATAVMNSRIIDDLREEKSKTVSIIYSLNDGLIIYDLDGKITLINPRSQELLWIDINQIVGKKIDSSIGEKSVYLKNVFNIHNLISGIDFITKEYITEGPHKRILQITQIPVVDDNREKIGYMHILHDITKEKELEELKSSFVTTASHQLRTPLTSIKWSLDELLKGGQGVLSEGQKLLITKTFGVNEHLIHLVNDLLDVSRIEEGRYGYKFALMDIRESIDKVKRNLEGLILSKHINFTLKVSAEAIPEVSVDPEKIDIAIQNIIENAIRYSKMGGDIKVTVKKEGEELLISVEDKGIGISEDEQKFIFNKFFRAKNAVKFQTEGSGLGLFIAKNIMNTHKGRLTFISEENKGSIFTITLPTSEDKMPKGSIKGI